MSHLVIVRRGAAGVYEALKAEFERDMNTAGVQVMWDRRQGERRETIGQIETERRRQDRRGRPPAAWSSLGILVVDGVA